MLDKVTRQCPQTTTFLKRKESRSGIEPRSRGPSAYQPNALPLGHTGSLSKAKKSVSCFISYVYTVHVWPLQPSTPWYSSSTLPQTPHSGQKQDPKIFGTVLKGGGSGKRAGGRLQLNRHSPLTWWSGSGWLCCLGTVWEQPIRETSSQATLREPRLLSQILSP